MTLIAVTTKQEQYDLLCKEADKLLEQHDPCKFIYGQCIYSREQGIVDMHCCGNDCKWLGDEGCKTSNLACKTAFGCDALYRNYDLATAIHKLRSQAWKLGVKAIHIFQSREEILNDI